MSAVSLSSYQDYFETIDEEGNTIPHYDYPDVWTSFAKDALMNVFLYAAIALVVILVVVGIFVSLRKPESMKSFMRTALGFACGFAVTVIAAMLSLEFFDMYENGYVFDLVLWPSVACVSAVVLGIAAIYISSLYSKKTFRLTSIISGSVIGASVIALFACLSVYFSSGAAGENNGVVITVSENVGMCICAVVLVAAIVVCAFLFDKGTKGFDSKSISYAAICIAMSFALSYIAPIHMPQGGSVTIASLVPLMLYSFMFGTKKGVLAGAVYGFMQIIQDPWIVHPAQLLLDYPIAFAGIGLAGMFAHVKKLEKLPQLQFALGAIVGSVFRFAGHLLSGAFAFSEYAPEGMNVWVYSLGYNGSYVFPDIAIAIAAGIIVLSSPSFVKQLRKYSKKKSLPAGTQPEGEVQEPVAPAAEVPAEAPMQQELTTPHPKD